MWLVVFSVKGNKTELVSQMKDKTFPSSVKFSLRSVKSDGHLVCAKTVVFMFVLFHVFICDFNRDTCLLFLVTCVWIITFLFLTLVHLRPNWGLSLALQCPGKMVRKGEVVLWTSDTFIYCFVPYATLQHACFLMFIGNIWKPDHNEAWMVQTMVLFLSFINEKDPDWTLCVFPT